MAFLQCMWWALLPLSTGKVQVSVQSAGEQVFSIEAQAAEFSAVPYGGYIQGVAVKVPSRLCQAYDVRLSPQDRYIFVLERGDCEFIAKTINAQKAGAIAVVVYDNVDEGLVTMGSNQQTADIPALLVRREDGLRIMRASNFLSLNITFGAGRYSRPSLELVLTSLPYYSHSLHSSLQALRTLSPYLTYRPFYVVLECESCGVYTAAVKNCLGGGRYCSRQGIGFLQEVIRQECIREGNYTFSQYLDYMETWVAECLNCTMDCSEGYAKAGIDPAYVNQCFQASFHPSFSLTSSNFLLERAQRDFVSFSPDRTLYLCGEAFQGEQTAETVQRALCSVMLDPPALCSEALCAPNCWPELLNNQACDLPCNSTACQLDQGDCSAPPLPAASLNCAPGCAPEKLSNRLCDLPCNMSTCGYDQGDCYSKDIYYPASADFPYIYLFLWYRIYSSIPLVFLIILQAAQFKPVRLLFNSPLDADTRPILSPRRELASQPFDSEMIEFGSADCAICIVG